jgi:hypothetical protein
MEVIGAGNGLRMIVGERSDLLAANKGRTFARAETKGYVGGADMVTNSVGERVLAGTSADDTQAKVAAHTEKRDRRRRENVSAEPSEVG